MYEYASDVDWTVLSLGFVYTGGAMTVGNPNRGQSTYNPSVSDSGEGQRRIVASTERTRCSSCAGK